jgi:radical SAM superfamily enzyme YgiQ (UPF0313 family)
MEDVLFVQFYRIAEDPVVPAPAGKTVLLSNGFSFVWNECRNIGDFLWVEEVPDFTDHGSMMNNKLPIRAGKVYVSAWYAAHLVQAIVWAAMYPDIDFVVGGHAVMNSPTIPHLSNLRIARGLAEQEIFGMARASRRWNLEIPDSLLPQGVDNVMFSYTVERKCYWGKCNFCDEVFTGSKVERFDNDVSSLYVPDTRTPSKVIFLYEPSVSPRFLRRHYMDLPRRDDVYFSMFYRGDHVEAQALREVFSRGEGPKPMNTLFVVGVEFPSNRMLEWIRKGTTVESVLETVRVLCEHNANVVMLLISGWDNLVESDVVEATGFFGTVREYNETYGGNVFPRITGLVFSPGTSLTEEYLQIEEKRTHMKADKLGGAVYMIGLDEEQRALNERVAAACRESFPGKEIQLEYDKVVADKLFPPDIGN